MVRVDELVAGLGLKVAVVFDGTPLTLSETEPLNPFSPWIVTT